MRRCSLMLLALLVLAGCEAAAPKWVSPVAFDTTRAWIHVGNDSLPLLVEVAATEAQQTYGLMARPSLDPNSGMIFVYDSIRGGDLGFWMWRTRMPLDIAFLDSTGVIVRALTMQPCPSDLYATSCDTYLPKAPYRSALEVNGGWLAEHGVREGARVTLEGGARN
ncbi:MAG: DUF192 domain-containing protein [Gemmatimonadetes bacterium]|nr:DUF192 domain-containing protein [Gemmatimonadota bacterium]